MRASTSRRRLAVRSRACGWLCFFFFLVGRWMSFSPMPVFLCVRCNHTPSSPFSPFTPLNRPAGPRPPGCAGGNSSGPARRRRAGAGRSRAAILRPAYLLLLCQASPSFFLCPVMRGAPCPVRVWLRGSVQAGGTDIRKGMERGSAVERAKKRGAFSPPLRPLYKEKSAAATHGSHGPDDQLSRSTGSARGRGGAPISRRAPAPHGGPCALPSRRRTCRAVS
jgi:hypothetical protein